MQSYVSKLEDRVASLERLLQSQLPNLAEDHLQTSSTSMVPQRVLNDGGSMTEEGDGTYSAIANGVGFLSLRAAAEPYFLGSTSGFSLARMVHLMLSSSFSTLARQSMDFASPNASLLTSNWEAIESAKLAQDPPQHIADELVALYFRRIHSRYPIIDWVAFRRTYKRKHELEPSRRSDRMRLFVLHMVYAMGSRILELNFRREYDVSPEVC